MERTPKWHLGKTIHFTVLREKACWINSGRWCWHGAWHQWEPVQSRTPGMTIMTLSLQLLIYFSARVNKQQYSENYYLFSLSLLLTALHCLSPHANNTINMKFWEALQGPSKHTNKGNSLNGCLLALENQLLCAPSLRSLFAYGLPGPNGQS